MQGLALILIVDDLKHLLCYSIFFFYFNFFKLTTEIVNLEKEF